MSLTKKKCVLTATSDPICVRKRRYDSWRSSEALDDRQARADTHCSEADIRATVISVVQMERRGRARAVCEFLSKKWPVGQPDPEKLY
jgi:hypothetical protein